MKKIIYLSLKTIKNNFLLTSRRSSKNILSPCTSKHEKITDYESIEKTHGRIETRKIRVSALPAEYLGWHGVRQVMEIERIRAKGTKMTKEVVYAITSLSPDVSSPEKLLLYTRRHWAIENELNYSISKSNIKRNS